MNARRVIQADSRPALALAFLILVALALSSQPASARSCGIMGKPPGQWGMPMYQPIPYGMQRPMPSVAGQRAVHGQSVIDVARRSGDLGLLLAAMEAAGLTRLLRGDGPYTLVAPTDGAFARLPEGAMQELLADKAKLTALLKYHVIPGWVTGVDILERRTLNTASGQELPTSDLSVIRADIPARNGVIHVIDKVLLPAS